jgi:glutamyl-Q tRNA(Asp) synthetase
MPATAYVGRFAPSPTGPLHAGSMVAALASWLDAKAHGGQWLVRMEDVDGPRCIAGADDIILQQLQACGLTPDAPVMYQSTRYVHYETALQQLQSQNLVFPCACSRADIAIAQQRLGHQRTRHEDMVYPGTCRPDQGGLQSKSPRAWRAALPTSLTSPWPWTDRRLGPQQQDLKSTVGDFVLRRADGLWAYQLAVVVDDGAQGITHVVRGEDLADNTPRQQWLQGALSLPVPLYLHTPLVRNAQGEKLSKQTQAPAIETQDPLAVLSDAAAHLGLPSIQTNTVGEWLSRAVGAWPYINHKTDG